MQQSYHTEVSFKSSFFLLPIWFNMLSCISKQGKWIGMLLPFTDVNMGSCGLAHVLLQISCKITNSQIEKYPLTRTCEILVRAYIRVLSKYISFAETKWFRDSWNIRGIPLNLQKHLLFWWWKISKVKIIRILHWGLDLRDTKGPNTFVFKIHRLPYDLFLLKSL